ncbi:MAG: hypothetical protein AB1761_14560 [Pseudomonadota bacterium]
MPAARKCSPAASPPRAPEASINRRRVFAVAKAQAELEPARRKQRRDAGLLRTGFVSQAVLADEPTAALDTERGTKVMARLRRTARERRSAVITVTHDHRMIEGFDTVYHLDDGHLSRMAEAAAGAV